MPITTTQFGKHGDVLWVEFGIGDIMFMKGVDDGDSKETLLVFKQDVPKPIGEVTEEYKGKSTDDVPQVKMVMKFNNPESITALVHSLMELQKEVFNHVANLAKEKNKVSE